MLHHWFYEIFALCSHSENSADSDDSTYDPNSDDDDESDDDFNGHHEIIVIDLTNNDDDDDNEDNDDNHRQCSICINAILPDSAKYLPCAHGFH